VADHEKIERLKQQIESETEEERMERLAKAAKDPDRPRYHYQSPPAWMNDTLPFFWKGEHHIFFQYHPGKPWQYPMHWGHAMTKDLIHWYRMPIALSPESSLPDAPDRDHCYSGCVVEKDGLFYAVYGGKPTNAVCLAISKDLITWEKFPKNPVVSSTQMPPGTMNSDPCVWKETDGWYMLTGGEKPEGGSPFLYKSQDLIKWEYLHAIYVGPLAGHDWPEFFPLGDKYVLLTHLRPVIPGRSRFYPETQNEFGNVVWVIGDYKDFKFIPETNGILDYGLCMGHTLLDDRGRRILWSWIHEERTEEQYIMTGWVGAVSLPRILTILQDNTLGIKPLPEVNKLRDKHWKFKNIELMDSINRSSRHFDIPNNGCLEIMVEFEAIHAEKFGVVVQSTERITYDVKIQQLAGAPLKIDPNGRLRMRIYVDRSVTEIYANDRICKTIRTYHGPTHDRGVSVFARGGNLRVKSLDIWVMQPIEVLDWVSETASR